MPRKLAILLAALVASTGAVEAAEVQFIGGLNVLTQTQQCTGARVGGIYVARYRPAGIGSNGPHSDFNLYRVDFAEGHRLLNGTFDSSFKGVQAVVVGGGSGSLSGVKIAFSKQTTVKANSTNVYIEGDIKNFSGDPGCNVSFNFSGVRNHDFE